MSARLFFMNPGIDLASCRARVEKAVVELAVSTKSYEGS